MGNSLDPEEHGEMRTTLKSIGPAIAGIGLLLTVVGIVSFFSAFGGGGMPRYFWCAFLGLPLLGLGVMISKFAYLGKIARYMAGEVAPVGKDMTNYMVAGTKDSIRDVAAAVGDGFAAARIGGLTSDALVRCHKCNAENAAAAKFCDACGRPLAKTKSCEKCGELNDPDARFCDNCGVSVA
jgi:hypothetical protein